jgi:hypothetical protein
MYIIDDILQDISPTLREPSFTPSGNLHFEIIGFLRVIAKFTASPPIARHHCRRAPNGVSAVSPFCRGVRHDDFVRLGD